jgi:DNA-binding transcriptional regulator YiaG
MQRDPFSASILAFRVWHKLSQAQCAALIPDLSVRSLEKWERGTSAPPLWSQRLILDALCDAMNTNK